MKFYLIYGLNQDFTYVEVFDDQSTLKSFIENHIDDETYIVIYGNKIHKYSNCDDGDLFNNIRKED